jgi:hypothetical protein
MSPYEGIFTTNEPRTDRKDANEESRATLLTVTLLWLSIAGAGLWTLCGYENAPGIAAEAPHQWPTESKIARPFDKATLVMLVHPHCPCTRSSIGELAEIMAH